MVPHKRNPMTAPLTLVATAILGLAVGSGIKERGIKEKPINVVASQEERQEHKRSSEWQRVRSVFLATHSSCEACGGINDLQVHHVEAFHCSPEKELDPGNLITLCTDGPFHLSCHGIIGHAGNFKTNNPNVRRDAARMKELLSTGMKCETGAKE